MGTGATPSAVFWRKFSGIPKFAAFRRISAPGDSTRFPKVAGEAGPAPGLVPYTTDGFGDFRTGDIRTGDWAAGPAAAMTARTPGSVVGVALERTILTGLAGGWPRAIPKAFVPLAICTAGVAGDHGEPQGEPQLYVERAAGEAAHGEYSARSGEPGLLCPAACCSGCSSSFSAKSRAGAPAA